MKKLIITVLALCSAVGVMADNIRGVDIDFVNIGYANNAADTREVYRKYYGAVGYTYQIGMKEVTIAQFEAARAADSRVGSGNENYWNNGTSTVGPDAPASRVTAYEAMMFCNYLTTGDAYKGAYQFNTGGSLTAIDRDAAVLGYGTVYALPTDDEWYKAAYFRPDGSGYSLYANGTDIASSYPTQGTTEGWNYYKNSTGYVYSWPNYTWETGDGAEEQNGTYDMMGNVSEWCESAQGTLVSHLVVRGGDYGSHYTSLTADSRGSAAAWSEYTDQGFRIVAIPEPSSIGLITMAGGLGIVILKRFHS